MIITHSQIHLDDIAQFLSNFFRVDRFSNDQNGVYIPSERAIARFGLALEPWSELAAWTQQERLDGLFLHRPWQMPTVDIGVIAYHLAFDESLTIGFNPRLATVLEISNLEVLGEKEGRAIGMIGDIERHSFDKYCDRLNQIFHGCDRVIPGTTGDISRVAVVGAMTDVLVREAKDRGANIYITGQLRQPGKLALAETGISCVAIGHRRSEEWGLRSLSGLLRDRFSQLEVILPK
ncbi:Nif3-like dinuclear metal center hexameric protein [Synechocystis sp. PCC 7509]|uniref:Nif3-like dinuclear metal center hexameric protein n=1 Tax=Synechocystis sp. PCC 7509 TaxID=927677 RepID=UPI0002ABA741|nr:Nif3-like dinuclear metal center hexameric protein [Synechocystis sp. PCC 7509]